MNKSGSEKNKLKNNGIIIKPKGIKILKFSSNVREQLIQCIPLKKKPKPNKELKMNKFFL